MSNEIEALSCGNEELLNWKWGMKLALYEKKKRNSVQE